MKFKNAEVFDEKLILQVQNNEIIYNLNCEDYENVWKKRATWAEIAKRLKSRADICKKRWKNLRDVYKRCKVKKASNRKSSVHWRYFGLMQFLDNFTIGRRYPYKDKLTQPYETNSDWFQDEKDISLDSKDGIAIEEGCAYPETSDSLNSKAMEYIGNGENIQIKSEDPPDHCMSPPPFKPMLEPMAHSEDMQSTFSNLFHMAVSTISQQQEAQKDSTTLLLGALDKKIKSANLSAIQLTEMESSICTLVYEKLAKFNA